MFVRLDRLPLRIVISATLVIATAVSGCASVSSPAATVTPTGRSVATSTPTPPATAAPAATPRPTPEPSPTPAAIPDPLADLRIGDPYDLAELDAALTEGISTAMESSLGSMSSIVGFGFRQITRGGVPAGMVMGMSFPGLPGATKPAFFEAAIAGMGASMNVKVTKKTVLDRPVRVIAGPTAVFAAFQDGSTIVVTIATSERQAVTLAGALIKANP